MHEPDDLVILGDGPGADDLWRAATGRGLPVTHMAPLSAATPAGIAGGWPWPGDGDRSVAVSERLGSPAILTGRCCLAGGGGLLISTEGRTRNLSPGHVVLAPRARPVMPSWWRGPAVGMIGPGDERIGSGPGPERVVVIGGGHTGVEAAAAWADGRRDVVLVEAAAAILPGWDPDQSALMHAALAERGVTVLTGWRAVAVGSADHVATVRLRRGAGVQDRSESADLVVPALGWRPDLAGLGLERTRALVDRDGFLQVDSRLRTAEPGLSALGAAVALPLTPAVTRRQAEVVASAAAGLDPAPLRYGLIPRVVRGAVRLMAAGQTAEAARERGFQVVTGQSGAGDSWVRCVRDMETGVALGVQAAGPASGSLADAAWELLAHGGPVPGKAALTASLAEAWRRAATAEVNGD